MLELLPSNNIITPREYKYQIPRACHPLTLGLLSPYPRAPLSLPSGSFPLTLGLVSPLPSPFAPLTLGLLFPYLRPQGYTLTVSKIKQCNIRGPKV